MTMLTFQQAKRRHAFFREAIQASDNRGGGGQPLAETIWRGVTGAGEGSLISQAVADTTPREYATLVAVDDIPAAYATQCLLDAFDAAPAPRSAHEARAIAHQGWTVFRTLADQAGHQQHGKGGDMSTAWPVFKELQGVNVDKKKLRRIAELAGRMYRVLKGAKTKRVEGIPEEVVGLELGSDIGVLVPEEYALWQAGVAPRTDLAMRLSEHRAVQLKREGKEKKGRGPLVIALDESGSMCGQEDEWAKAAMTALTRIAWEDRRPVKVVHFSTATRVHTLKPGDHRGLLRAQCTFLDGGTDIGTAVMVAADEVEAWEKEGVRGADVVLVSDGGDAGYGISQALDRMDKTGVRLFSVAIGPSFTGQLRDRAAEYVHLDANGLTEDAVGAIGKAVN